jgi:DNA-binding MarR family transcriptional regulator
MAGRALGELKQTKPFTSLAEEAYINIQITADVHLQAVSALLKPHGLSAAQYNVLRILRGAGEAGLPSGEIAARMINRDPDTTRLLDRLEARGLAVRSRDGRDRRVVTVRATANALTLLASLDAPLQRCVDGLFRRLGDQKLSSLITYLEEAR